jgi:regulator of protease activity HflC (stomatin/prohibitin superfamily)
VIEMAAMWRNRRHYDHAEPSAGGGTVGPETVDPAAESLSQALRAGFNVLRVIIIILLGAYLLSGFFQVNPGEQGLVVHFGKLRINEKRGSEHAGTPIFDEGWALAWPDPFDEKIRISGQPYKSKIYAFCFPLQEEDLRKDVTNVDFEDVPNFEKLQPGVHGTLLSGDRNLSHGLFAIEYQVEDAARFVQAVASGGQLGSRQEAFEELLRRLAENAIVRTVAGMPVERVIRTQTDEATGDFTLEVKRRLAAELDRLETGVAIVAVQAQTFEPGRVREAFNRVTDAKSQRKELESKAWEEANRILSSTAGPKQKYTDLLKAIEAYGAAQTIGADDARLAQLRAEIDRQLDQAEGKVASMLRQAQSQANEIRERVRQEYELFVNYRDLYRKYPQLTVARLWVRMRDAVLSSDENEIFFVPEAGEIEILTNRDPQKRIDAEVKRYKERYERP